MRRLLTSILVLAATFAPAVALAGISNQEVAKQIAQHLKESGRLHHYSVAVTYYADGTVRLQGQVASAEQARIAINLAFQAECVKGIVNELKIVPAVAAQPAPAKESAAAGVQRAESASPGIGDELPRRPGRCPPRPRLVHADRCPTRWLPPNRWTSRRSRCRSATEVPRRELSGRCRPP